jgi:mgtE-like transporter
LRIWRRTILGLSSPGLLLLVAISVSAGLLVMTLVNVISYLIAVISFLYGFDPDNFGIPVITTAIDLLGAIALIAMIALFLA